MKKNKNIDLLEKNIKDLKNKNISLDKYKQEIQKLEKELDKSKKYFNSEENNGIKKIKEINELSRLNDRYKQEIRELKEKLNDNDISLNEYKIKLNRLNNRHEQKIVNYDKDDKDDTSEIKSNDDKKKEEIYTDMPYLETEEEAAERIADFYDQKKGEASKIIKEIVRYDEEDEDDEDNEDDEDDEDDMIKNARSLLKDVKNDKFNRVKVKDKFISKNEIIKFLKNITKGFINNDNKDKEYSVKLKSIKSDLNNASKKTNNIKKYIKYLEDIKKYYLLIIVLSYRHHRLLKAMIIIKKEVYTLIYRVHYFFV